MNEENNSSGIVYDTGAGDTAVSEKQSQTLEICALVFGILSIIGCCYYGVFGLTGLVLSIVAFVTGKKSGLSIGGFICSLIGILLTITLLVYTYFNIGQLTDDSFLKRFYGGYEKQDDTSMVEDRCSEKTESIKSEKVQSEETREVFAEQGHDNVNSDQNELGIVRVNGKEIRIPCKYADIKDDFEISDYNKEDMEISLESYETLALYLATAGEENGVRLRLRNNTDKTLGNIGEADVIGIEVEEPFDVVTMEVSFVGNIMLGTDTETLEAQLAGMEYEVEEEDGYTLYYAEHSPNNSSIFYFDVITFENKVVMIDLDYSDY